MIILQKPFPGAARTELESQLQRAVKVSAKGKHVKCKMDLERCLFLPRPVEFARRRGRALVEARHVWLMARQWGVLFVQWQCLSEGTRFADPPMPTWASCRAREGGYSAVRVLRYTACSFNASVLV